MGEPGLGLRLRFIVTIDGQGSLGEWTKCDGLAVEYEIVEYAEGGNNSYVHRFPGRRKYSNIRLTRVVNASTTAVMVWLASIQTDATGVTAQITVLDSAGDPVALWNLIGVFPAKWTGPSLDAGAQQVATETLELVHNGFLGGPL
jgi:phage tail-like protein